MITCQNAPVASLSMLPYTGSWSAETAIHLLRRTLFGPNRFQIDQMVSLGMDQAVESILQIVSPADPITWHPLEAVGSQGATWVNEFLPADETFRNETISARHHSMYTWFVKRTNQEQQLAPSITEKMCFFWHNHFSVTMRQDDRVNYAYHKLLETHALGNFQKFVEEMTINPSMMLFLDTASNTKWSPNENYARELLELFTVGKGPQIGPGDYSNFTEDDIAAGARILTGWKVREYASSVAHPYSEFDQSHHDEDGKTLSYHFNNAIVSNTDDLEYKDFIGLIFQKDETAYHIARKLYIFFVNTEITQDIEAEIINTMAQTLLVNNYEIRPVLVELFKSEHFYDIANIGAHLKSPFEFIFSMLNATETIPDYGIEGDNMMWEKLYHKAIAFDLNWGFPPSVAGWPAYYQAPAFMQHWLNSGTINNRFWCITQLTTNTNGIWSDEFGTFYNIKIDALNFLATIQDPSNGAALIDEICLFLLSRTLDQSKKDALLNTLTGGLPEFEWTLQYAEFTANPGDVTFSDPIKSKVEEVLSQLFMFPEFQSC